MITIIIVREEQLDKILARLSSIEEALRRLASVSAERPVPAPDAGPLSEMIDNREMCRQLRVTKRTLARYRASGMLTYSLIGGRLYYSEEDVKRLMAFFRNKKKTSN